MKTSVVVNIKMPGVHRWPGCNIPEVEYLKNYHRHIFHIKCWLAVNHSDREVEILTLKKKIKDYLKDEYYDSNHDVCFFDHRSCEMIAIELYNYFSLEACEVLEDGENGALYSGMDWSDT